VPLALLFALLAAGCGSGGTTVGGGNRAAAAGSTPAGARAAAFDPRDAPLGCLNAKGVHAQKDAQEPNRLEILPVASGAYITFAASPAEAEGIQLRNEDPGAEAIGPRLLSVGHLPDAQLRAIESCLQAQGIRY
ncbi:MAG TPA: hypothetical protein VFU94_04790, partial [Conexibacter sp.]|nr:hypothetical protein [Conexibacter sp.]